MKSRAIEAFDRKTDAVPEAIGALDLGSVVLTAGATLRVGVSNGTAVGVQAVRANNAGTTRRRGMTIPFDTG
jgi:hypothetical protein